MGRYSRTNEENASREGKNDEGRKRPRREQEEDEEEDGGDGNLNK